jgi:hypothetical protein
VTARKVLVVALGLFALARAEDAGPLKATVPPELLTEASPALRTYGEKHGLRLDGWAPLRTGDPRPGDAVVVLATFFDSGPPKQWLVEIAVDVPPAEPVEKNGGGMTLYTSTGRTFKFPFSWIALKLLTIGPVVAGDRQPREPEVQHGLVRLNGEYLGLGIHQANELFEVERASGEKIDYSFSGEPFEAQRVAEGKKMAERVGLTEASERAFAGTIPAMLEFFEVVRNTPGVRDILFQVLEKPSPWSMLKAVANRSMNIGFAFSSEGSGLAESPAWGSPAPAVRAVPMTLSLAERPALQFTLYATEPKPPLRASAGIIGLKAASPKNPSRYVVLRVIATATAELK